ncbi:MAG: HPr family phosphocarrier protein [Oscillospiraceae bacterium]|nr:HPr family phosphocarrier protein [Oscillospiraceae bacterium]
MKQLSIMLHTINDVKEFVGVVSHFDYDIDLISGRYAVDAKSIIGIFSLDLSKPLKVNIYSEDCAELLEKLEKFLQP